MALVLMWSEGGNVYALLGGPGWQIGDMAQALQ